MKCFELLSLLVVVFEFGLFGAVNDNFRAERPNIDEQPNLVHLVDCSGQTITYNGNSIPNGNPFTVNNSNDGEYRCVYTDESVTVIRKSSILLYIIIMISLFSAIPGPTINNTRAADWGQHLTLDCEHRPGNYRDGYLVAWHIRSSNEKEARICRPDTDVDICSNFSINPTDFSISFCYYPTRNHFCCQVTNTADPSRPNPSPILTAYALYPTTNPSGMR